MVVRGGQRVQVHPDIVEVVVGMIGVLGVTVIVVVTSDVIEIMRHNFGNL